MDISMWRFDDKVPANLQLELDPILTKVEQLVPKWVQYINVDIENNTKCPAQITPRYDYRRAYLTFGMAFFVEKRTQLEVLVHEMMHLYQEPLWNYTCDIRAKLLEDYPDMGSLWVEQGRHVREQMTCDMAELIYLLITNK